MKPEALEAQSKEAIRFVLQLMKTNLSEKCTYHSLKHTHRVMSAAENLAISEGVSPRSVELLRLAAAWHDCGYLDGPMFHEEKSCELVQKYLPDFGFGKSIIDEICTIIMATKIPTNPTDLLQKIICDADLHYLGTGEYEQIAEQLYQEFNAFGILKDAENWVALQISFLESHRFYTPSAINLYEETKSINLEHLRRSIGQQILI